MKTLTREEFVTMLIKKMDKDINIWLLYIDLGFGFLHKVKKMFPERCLNTGLIEQSAIGIACGLAKDGKKVYVYSTSTFLIFRALEQIRNDIGSLDITLVGTTGKQYNFLGRTHVIEDNEDIKVLDAIKSKVKYIRLV